MTISESEASLAAVVESAAALGTDSGLLIIAQSIARVVGSRWVRIEERSADLGSARTLASWGDGAPAEHRERALAGTPCADVYLHGSLEVLDRVAERYLSAPLLAQHGVAAYVGRSLRDAEGHPFAHVSVMHDAALSEAAVHSADFCIVIEHARVELLRHRAERWRHTLERRLVERQRLHDIGRMSSALVHDANNLLMAASGHMGLAAAFLPPDSRGHESLQEADDIIARVASMMGQLTTYSGRRSSARRVQDLGVLIEGTSDLLRLSAPTNVTVRLDLRADVPPVDIDAEELRRVVVIMLRNAVEAIGDAQGVVTLRIGLRPAGDHGGLEASGPSVVLEIEDSGPGIDPELQAQIFEPWFTTKPGSLGLGLATALDIMRRHGGAIDVDTEPGRGATFSLSFPPRPNATARPAPDPRVPAAEAPAVRLTVLVVDDQVEVREVVRLMLESMNFVVVCAEDGARAVDLLRSSTTRIDLVLLDMSMPGEGGREVLSELRAVRSDLKVILMSGALRKGAASEPKPEGTEVLLHKPFRVETLGYAVAEAMLG